MPHHQARLLSRLSLCLLGALSATACLPFAAHAQASRPGSEIKATQAALPAGVVVQEWVKGLKTPWAVALLPDGGALVTERPGQLRVIAPDGKASDPVSGVPKVVAAGQGGLLDVILDPDFRSNNTIYLSFSEAGESGGNSTAVARGQLTRDGQSWSLRDVKVIFRQAPKYNSTAHFGSRLVADGKGHLFITLGDRFSRRDDAQTLDQHHGKIVRVRTDGGVPDDNPFVARKEALGEIWSLGHRNVQGAAVEPTSGVLWIHEHGPQGGDEINIVRAGANYGWPRYTYGENYGGGRIGEEASPKGFEPPLYAWVPSIAPSGMAFYTADAVPAWRGSLFVGALRAQALVRLTLRDGKVVGEERLLGDRGERVRDVRAGADGYLYVVTDGGDGKVLRIGPGK